MKSFAFVASLLTSAITFASGHLVILPRVGPTQDQLAQEAQRVRATNEERIAVLRGKIYEANTNVGYYERALAYVLEHKRPPSNERETYEEYASRKKAEELSAKEETGLRAQIAKWTTTKVALQVEINELHGEIQDAEFAAAAQE